MKPNFNNVTPVRLLKLPINKYFLENYPEDIELL